MIDFCTYRTASTFQELQSIQVTMRNHDNKIMKMLSNRPVQVQFQ